MYDILNCLFHLQHTREDFSEENYQFLVHQLDLLGKICYVSWSAKYPYNKQTRCCSDVYADPGRSKLGLCFSRMPYGGIFLVRQENVNIFLHSRFFCLFEVRFYWWIYQSINQIFENQNWQLIQNNISQILSLITRFKIGFKKRYCKSMTSMPRFALHSIF
jgi:hypothetical protein